MSEQLSRALGDRPLDPPKQLEPSSQFSESEPSSPSRTAKNDESPTSERKSAVSSSDATEMKSSSPPTFRTSAVSRSGTLSWQQRPSSRDLGSSRPVFPNFARPDSAKTVSTTPTDDQEPDRSQIALSLASKDPSWFRQTPDRGIGSPALRKDTEVTGAGVTSLNKKQQLPGMDRETTTDPEKPGNEEAGGMRSSVPSRASSTFGNGSLGNRYSSISPASPASALGSPVPVSASQKLEPRKDEPLSEEQSTPPHSQRRLSPERSTSPTKGLGGFVQSAMMKRSDSVSKRWSAQASPRRSRTNSIASNRNSVAVSSFGDLSSGAWKSSLEIRPPTTSRPGSSHSEATVHAKDDERPATPPASNNARPNSSLAHVRPSSALSNHDQETESKPQTPTSPFVSKTMDSKRWSPTKATWLESALNRPESPRQKKAPQQPNWMRDRQARGSVDLGRSNSFKEVTPVGLMRSPAPGSHYKKPSASGVSDVISTPETRKANEKESDPKLNIKGSDASPPVEDSVDGGHAPDKEEPQVESKPGNTLNDNTGIKRSPPSVAPKPNITLPSGPPRDPLLTRPKPQSPVIDFRANLRRRETVRETTQQEEPEFKNVFGKLRRAETTSYVPQDELKKNILKGKAALHATSGPKKSQRVDELKENILKQKEAIKAAGGSLRGNATEDHDALEKPPVPEAIARRNNLSRSDSLKSNRSDGLSPVTPKAAKPPPSLLGKKPPSPRPSEDSGPQPPAVGGPKNGDSRSDMTGLDFVDREASDEGKNETLVIEPKQDEDIGTPQKLTEKTIKPVRPLPSTKAVPVAHATAASEGLVTKGKLAGRINPALAGLLSRGPPVAGGASSSPPAASISQEVNSVTPTQSAEPQTPTSLTHMTKGRARGPKRRLPKNTTIESAPKVQNETPSYRSAPSLEVKKTRTGLPVTQSASTLPLFNVQQKQDEGTSQGQLKPRVASKPTGLGKNLQASYDEGDKKLQSVSATANAPTQSHDSQDAENAESTSSNKPALRPKPATSISASFIASRQVSQSSNDRDSEAKFKDTAPRVDLDLDKLPSRQISSMSREVENKRNVTPPLPGKPVLPPKPSRTPSPFSLQKEASLHPSSPSPLRTNLKENRMDSHADSQPKLGHGFEKNGIRNISPLNKTLPPPPIAQKTSGISLGESSIKPKPPPKSSSLSPVPRTGEAAEVISNFFETFPKSSDRVDIDPQFILENKMQDLKIRTLKMQIWEITGDGKRQDLPTNQEYILYEGSMYLCLHVFESDGNTRSEIHLWHGDGVGEAALEDAQLFARKIARENGCKLELTKQGKETARFIQALGGIIVTRRGSSSRSSSSALYMLCGRKHLKQMAFDEVDFSRRSLCSGYPFVLSARFGKVYLWKGKGSGAEEVGAARLIGMDLGLTGDFEEVVEGEEPEGFFENFSDNKDSEDYMRSEHWRLKPSHPHFNCRLLRLDHELGQRSGFWIRRSGSSSPVIRPNDTVQEIEPFCFKDITMRDIYVLDAFFEIYV